LANYLDHKEQYTLDRSIPNEVYRTMLMQEALINSLYCTMTIEDTGFREPLPLF